MRNFPTALLLAAALAILAGCGQTGPLYMPTENVPKPPPVAPQDSAEQSSKNS
jgi:predicted small lipoprotein YifL